MRKLLLCGLFALLLVCIAPVVAYVPLGDFTVQTICDPVNDQNEVVCHLHGEYSGPDGTVETAAIYIDPIGGAGITQASGNAQYTWGGPHWIFPDVQNGFKTDQEITTNPDWGWSGPYSVLVFGQLTSAGTTTMDFPPYLYDPSWQVTDLQEVGIAHHAFDDSVMVFNCPLNDLFNVLDNDITGSDFNNRPLTLQIIDPPSHGSVHLYDDGFLHYYPDFGYFGADTMTYRIYDGVAYSNVATVTIQTASYAGGGSTYYFSTEKDTPLVVPSYGGWNGQFQCDTPMGLQMCDRVNPSVSHGTLILGDNWGWDGSFTYVPDAGYSGTDRFTYTPHADSGTYGDCYGPDNTIIITIIDSTPPPVPKVTFNQPDTALCQFSCYNPPISAVVSGLGAGQKVDLQLTYQILHPSFLENQKKYISLDNVGNGEYPITPQMFGVNCLWPGIPPESSWPATEQKVMEIHFGANLLDPDTGNCITQPCTTGSQDFYWYPWVCGFPPVVPEFPSPLLPIIMIIGFLGAVLLILRTREN